MSKVMLRKSVVVCFLALAMMPWVLLCGCESHDFRNQTDYSVTTAWPLFDVEKRQGVKDDGVKWEYEKGDAFCWLATWEKRVEYSPDGTIVYRKKRSGFFPLFHEEIVETKGLTTKKGMILIYPYESEHKLDGGSKSTRARKLN